MPRTRAELDAIRATNRAALGLADYLPPETQTAALAPYPGIRVHAQGMAGTVPGGMGGPLDALMGGAIPSVRIRTSFPPVDVKYVPGQSAPAEQTGPGWADWINRHLVRPEVEIGDGIRVAPYAKDADFSGLAKAATVGVAIVTTGGLGWILYRAFFGGRSQ